MDLISKYHKDRCVIEFDIFFKFPQKELTKVEKIFEFYLMNNNIIISNVNFPK